MGLFVSCIFTLPAGAVAKYWSQHVCLCVCLRSKRKTAWAIMYRSR